MSRVREKFPYPLVQKVLLRTSAFNDLLLIDLILCQHPRFFIFSVDLNSEDCNFWIFVILPLSTWILSLRMSYVLKEVILR